MKIFLTEIEVGDNMIFAGDRILANNYSDAEDVIKTLGMDHTKIVGILFSEFLFFDNDEGIIDFKDEAVNFYTYFPDFILN